MQSKSERIILGIDPGTTMMGFGVIKASGKDPEYLDMGAVDLKREGDHYMRLRKIYERTLDLMDTYLPDEVVFEYAPRKIKLSITSAGDASKEQVARMLQRMFNLPGLPENLDATDGLAAAVCHFYQKDNILPRSGVKNWEEFIRKNPDRLK